MYVCICNGITEEQLKQAAGHSANAQEAIKKLGVGSSCGVCLVDALQNLGLPAHSNQKQQNSIDKTSVRKLQK